MIFYDQKERKYENNFSFLETIVKLFSKNFASYNILSRLIWDNCAPLSCQINSSLKTISLLVKKESEYILNIST